jgi:DNA-binding beta-propeller fold protein YncE
VRRPAVAFALAAAACAAPGTPPIEVPPLAYGLDQHWPERSTYPGVGAGRVVVTNNLDDTVSLLDLARVGEPDFAEVARIPVGLNPVETEGPHHAAIDPAGEFFYVAISNFVPGTGSGPHGAHGTGTADGHVLKLRAANNRLVGRARVDRNPGDLALSPDGRTLYVTHFDLLRVSEVAARGGSEEEMRARLAVIDTATMTRTAMVPLCAAPHGVRPSADGKRVYVACYSDEVAVVQADDPAFPVTRVKVAAEAGGATSPRHEPYAVAVSPANGEVWASCLRSGEVHAFTAAPLAADPARAPVLPGSPIFGDFSADGAKLYVAYQGADDGIAVIDAATGAVDRNIALRPSGCLNAHQVALAPGGRFALVVCEGDHRGSGLLLVLDLDANAALSSKVELGVFPDFVGILVRPGG